MCISEANSRFVLSSQKRPTGLFRKCPELGEEDIRQALAYAAASLEDQVVDFHYKAAA